MHPEVGSTPGDTIHCPMLGVEVTDFPVADLISTINLLATKHVKSIIVGHNLHSSYLFHTNQKFASVYRSADIILADGKPVELDARLGARIYGHEARIVRLGSTDWIPSFLESTSVSRVCVVGTSLQSNQAFIRKAMQSLPSASFLGIPGCNWSSRRAAEVVRRVQGFGPDIVFVGLGMPLQEEFIYESFNSLPDSVYVLVGGAIDQIAGYQTLAPRWLGRIGLEWLWRLCRSPRRLGERYLVEPWLLLSTRLLGR